MENFLISDAFSLRIPCGLYLIVQKFFFLLLFFLFFDFFFQDGGCTCPGDVSKAFGKWFFNIIWEKNYMIHAPNSPLLSKQEINNLFWSKFLFLYTYYMEPACFITLFHVWPQVLVQILSWWGACLLAMISLVSKAWSLLSFANDSLKNTATFYVNNYFIHWLMNVYYFFALRLGVAL